MNAGHPPLRRVPRQARGERRLAALLDAADRVFAAVGYEGATTNAIAREASTSIGSLYQFFPDKDAMLLALADRYRVQLHALHDQLFNEDTARLPLAAIYDRVVNNLAEFHAAHPGFRPLFYGSTTSPQLAAAAATLHEECIGRVDGMLAVRHPDLDPTLRRLYATINVEVVKSLLPLAASGDADFRQRVLQEIKALLLARMRDVLGEGATA